MGTALFTGVTGLLAFQRKLDVVADNISNVNTVGYRGSRALFQDLFKQTLQGARAPVGNFGGSNPIQTGLGVRLATIDLDLSQGSLLTTGSNTDLAIQGSGFFMWDWGTPPWPTANVPPTAGADPHDFHFVTPALLALYDAFLQPDGQIIDVCGGGPCQSPPPSRSGGQATTSPHR